MHLASVLTGFHKHWSWLDNKLRTSSSDRIKRFLVESVNPHVQTIFAKNDRVLASSSTFNESGRLSRTHRLKEKMRNQSSTPTSYKADITAGALKLTESRLIADLLLRQVNADGWKEAVVTNNVLQARNPDTSRRLAKLIRSRLETMGPDLWKLVRDGNGQVATHAVFAAAIKHSHLLGDFLKIVVSEQYRRFAPTLTKKLFDDYLLGCRERDLNMPQWNESTRRRLRSSVFQMLAQAGYIENTKNLQLQRVHFAEQVLHYLKANQEAYVLQCVEVTK